MEILRNSTYKINQKNLANGLNLLSKINDNAISVMFFDPQYRGGCLINLITETKEK